MDAQVFMQQNQQKYDAVLIDIFDSRIVPEFVVQNDFLHQCLDATKTGGYVIFNYIVNQPNEWLEVKDQFAKVFGNNHIIDLGLNQVLIGTIPS